MSMWWWVFAGVLVVLVGLYLSMTAGRLDRLHRRIDTSRQALDTQLLQRSALCLEIASSSLFDPATAVVLADSAHAARASADGDVIVRGLAESDLTRVLVAAIPDPQDAEVLREESPDPGMLEDLRQACVRVQLSRRFHNDAVRACRQVRKQRLVRWLRLAGRTPWPVTVEMDDTPPPGLSVR
ncbi:MAG: hypothetical protein ACO3ID_01010 [Candidatus Nanopelagicales bacterium]|jgi:hypothetical protein